MNPSCTNFYTFSFFTTFDFQLFWEKNESRPSKTTGPVVWSRLGYSYLTPAPFKTFFFLLLLLLLLFPFLFFSPFFSSWLCRCALTPLSNIGELTERETTRRVCIFERGGICSQLASSGSTVARQKWSFPSLFCSIFFCCLFFFFVTVYYFMAVSESSASL